jgi:flagellar biosynthesis/type III secretory pathway protein FliH
LDQVKVLNQSCGQIRIERFEYIHMPCAPGSAALFGVTEVLEESAGAEVGSNQSGSAIPACAYSAESFAEESRRAFAAGREQGLMEGRQLEREAHAVAMKRAEDQHRQNSAKLLDQFAQERDRYLQSIEKEVVKLALAVAARILRREAQMDPLLLTGAVRVALGQLSGSTQARVRVPLAELELWKETVALLPNLALQPQVVAGEEMRLGDCMIETSLGSVDLGIRSQLGEIERGFFDTAVRSNVRVAATAHETESTMSRA